MLWSDLFIITFNFNDAYNMELFLLSPRVQALLNIQMYEIYVAFLLPSKAIEKKSNK